MSIDSFMAQNAALAHTHNIQARLPLDIIHHDMRFHVWGVAERAGDLVLWVTAQRGRAPLPAELPIIVVNPPTIHNGKQDLDAALTTILLHTFRSLHDAPDLYSKNIGDRPTVVSIRS